MTIKEAIKILKQQKYPYPSYPKDIEVNEAIDLAIKALDYICEVLKEDQKEHNCCYWDKATNECTLGYH